MLFNAHAPANLWVHAFSSAIYIINMLPTPILSNKSPFEVLFHTVPNYEVFRIFGCRVFPYLLDYSPYKLAPRSTPCIFLGYCTQYKGYKCLDPTSQHIYTTRHAQFDESIFPYTGVTSSSDLATIAFTTFDDQGTPSMPTVPNINNNSSSTVVSSTTSSPCKLCPTLPLSVPQHQPVATDAPFQPPP